jgi:predicted SAM-dependent methyltransferase
MSILKSILTDILIRMGLRINRINTNDIAMYIRLYGEESVEKRRFYNISAGAFIDFGCGIHHPCWTNIDVDRPWKDKYNPNCIEFDPKTDIAHDLLSLSPIPVESSTAELIHSRFTIASITDEAALYFFKEVFRMLKPGGVFRVNAPNIDLDYRAYRNNDMSFFYWIEIWFGKDHSISIEQAFLQHIASQASTIHSNGIPDRITDEQFKNLLDSMNLDDALDYCTSKCSVEIQKDFRNDHINWWNPEKLERMLRSAGFQTVYISDREQSASPVMRNEAYFDNIDNKFVMYMEAVK